MSAVTPATGTPHYFNTKEAAGFLRISPRTLEKKRVYGSGPRFRKLGSRVVYALPDLEAWSDANSFAATYECTGTRSRRTA
jgi:hypothetical protein